MGKRPIYVASLSYGKDSMAMLHVITDVLQWPLDRIITADVWATDTIPAEYPPVVEFKKKADRAILERWGIEVEHFCAMEKTGERTTYDKCLHKPITKQGKGFEDRIGLNRGFPYQKGPWCQRDLKVKALEEVQKWTFEDVFYHVRKSGKSKGKIVGFPSYPGHPECSDRLKAQVLDKAILNQEIRYIGIATDEGKRTERHKEKAEKGLEKLPLVEAGWTERMCMDWCRENDLLSPTYTTSTRDGCWFCHNQGVDQLRQLRKNYPDLWALLLKWDSDSPVTFKADGHTVHDFDKRFQWEDEGFIPMQKQFRWEDINNPQMNLFQFLGGENE